MAIALQWTMDNSDINVVGEELGFEWNAVCASVQDCGIYGQDGAGGIYIDRSDIEEFECSMIRAIFTKIFNDHPGMEDIHVIDNF